MLALRTKTVDKCMTPLADVFMLSLTDKLDESGMDRVLARTTVSSSGMSG